MMKNRGRVRIAYHFSSFFGEPNLKRYAVRTLQGLDREFIYYQTQAFDLVVEIF
jgi:hypothetical protein